MMWIQKDLSCHCCMSSTGSCSGSNRRCKYYNRHHFCNLCIPKIFPSRCNNLNRDTHPMNIGCRNRKMFWYWSPKNKTNNLTTTLIQNSLSCHCYIGSTGRSCCLDNNLGCTCRNRHHCCNQCIH